ncbi:phosphatase PAP2 family protein [Tomitella cavernea]|uniref:Phosphatase PAP2 family protein n=1 Tax=Tomitella cavernea TaxID=1387982 RepID=A0ABP9C836_9ACTN|nr:phosphatase PAP2 family protein [Tomitella cavernea]
MSAKDDLVAAAAAAETPVLAAVQDVLIDRPGVLTTARGMSHFGEHALGWMAVSAAGAAVDRSRRGRWLAVGAGAVGAHAASIAVKRVVRRPRPQDPMVRVGVSTPSRLSFPSSHATSSTAAALLIGRASGVPVAAAVVPAMALSRLLLGVHYPSDVVAGSAIGALAAVATDRLRRRVPVLRDEPRPRVAGSEGNNRR